MNHTFGSRLRHLVLSLLVLFSTAVQADPKGLTAGAETALRNGDLPTAMNLFRQAAEAGYAPAQARLGDVLDIAEQDAEAVEWYRKSAAQNDPAGEYGLGRMLANGEGVTRDPVQALAMFRRAVEKNHPPAIEELARAYRAGSLGLTKDLAEAQRLEAKARALREAAKGSR